MSDGVFPGYQDVLRHKRRVLRMLRERVESMSAQTAGTMPPTGGWSARQTLEHLVIVEEGILAIVERLLRRAGTSGRPAAPFRVDVSAEVREYFGRKIKTRSAFEPRGKLDPAESLTRLDAVLGRLEEIEPRLEAVDPTSETFPHWELGPMNLAEWIAFIGLHEERHLAQLGLGAQA